MILFSRMSQESNTTSDTNPKPRLQPDGAPENAPASGGAPGAGALPRLSFKKRTEDAPAPPSPSLESSAARTPPAEITQPPLKRPPPGTRLVPSGEADSTGDGAAATGTGPGKRGTTGAPFDGRGKSPARRNLAMMIGLVLLLVVALGEAYVIFVMHDQNTIAENSAKPPLLVNNGPGGKPYEVVNKGGPAPTPAFQFLLTFSPQIASGNEPRLFLENKTYLIGQVVDSATGLKWIRINDQTRELEFVDKEGRHYIKKF